MYNYAYLQEFISKYLNTYVMVYMFSSLAVNSNINQGLGTI